MQLASRALRLSGNARALRVPFAIRGLHSTAANTAPSVFGTESRHSTSTEVSIYNCPLSLYGHQIQKLKYIHLDIILYPGRFPAQKHHRSYWVKLPLFQTQSIGTACEGQLQHCNRAFWPCLFSFWIIHHISISRWPPSGYIHVRHSCGKLLNHPNGAKILEADIIPNLPSLFSQIIWSPHEYRSQKSRLQSL